MLRKFLLVKFLLVLGLLALAWPPLLLGQFIGYNAAQSTSQNLFTNQAANGTSVTITNLGQSSHFVTVCNFNFVGTVLLESSQDGTFSPPNTVTAANYGITPGNPDNNCHLVQAGGYYRTMRARVANYVSGSTSVFYSGIGGPIGFAPAAISTIGPSSPVACDNTALNENIPASTSGIVVVPQLTTTTIIVCSVTYSFSSNTTAGSIILAGASAGGGPGTPCIAAFRDVFTIAINSGSIDPEHFLGGAGGLFRLRPGESLCISTGSIGSITVLDLSFAQITF